MSEDPVSVSRRARSESPRKAALRRKRRMPASPSRVRGQPHSSAREMLELVRSEALPTPGWRSVQSVISTATGDAGAVPAMKVRVVGEKVQTEALGRPEQAKVNVPEAVLEGVTKMATSEVEPSATATRGTPEMKFGTVQGIARLGVWKPDGTSEVAW